MMQNNIKVSSLSGFLNHCNGAEGIHNFGDLCKYRHIRQAKGGTRASLSTHPTLETNKQGVKLQMQFYKVFDPNSQFLPLPTGSFKSFCCPSRLKYHKYFLSQKKAFVIYNRIQKERNQTGWCDSTTKDFLRFCQVRRSQFSVK